MTKSNLNQYIFIIFKQQLTKKGKEPGLPTYKDEELSSKT